MPTPYITPDILTNAPTGISWETVPNYDSSITEQLAEQTNICWRTTHFIDEYCNQPLRATINTEEALGPDYRVTIDHNGLVRFVPSRWPVTSVLGGQYSAAFVVPPNWSPIPESAMYIENINSVSGDISTVAAAGPSSILISPGYVSWWNGRRGCRVQVTYTNGYAHTGMQANASIGDTTIVVDDCTGMSGSTMMIYDGSSTETVNVKSTTEAEGPGIATLVNGLIYDHSASVQEPLIVSAIPSAIQQAAINYAAYIALTRGATATTVQMLPGASTGGSGASGLLQDAKDLLKPYRRVI